MKLKSFCTAKEMVTKLKRLSTEWNKISAIYTTDRGLITRLYRELKILNSQKVNDPMKKRVKEPNRAISKDQTVHSFTFFFFESLHVDLLTFRIQAAFDYTHL
jgi:hypothetical protein